MLQEKSFAHKTVSQIVRDDYRTADVFRQYGINYCCAGAILLPEACDQKRLNQARLISALHKATQTVSLPASLSYQEWRIDFLTDYIVNVHHHYMNKFLPKLEASFNSFAQSHQKKLPHLEEVSQQLHRLVNSMQAQMNKEESVIFPYIKQLAAAHRDRYSYGRLFIKTLRKPLQLKDDASRMHLSYLRELTGNYEVPHNACTNHHVLWKKLEALDADFGQHEYLENEILYPRAKSLEDELLQINRE